MAAPVPALATGTERYREVKATVAGAVLDRLPETLASAEDYARSTIDLEGRVIDNMSQLTDEEYAAILRPVFKDDRALMITVGAVLGGVVGELKVQVIERFTQTKSRRVVGGPVPHPHPGTRERHVVTCPRTWSASGHVALATSRLLRARQVACSADDAWVVAGGGAEEQGHPAG